MHVHEALAQALYDNGIHDAFGVVGDANLFIMDGFQKAGGRYIPTATEAGSVLAALGYAQVSGDLGVASVTHGPGLTNTFTALVEAARARVPLIVVAGDTPATTRDHIQDIDQRAVALAAGAGFQQVHRTETAVSDLAHGIRRAWLESLPVVINVPIDIQWDTVDYRAISGKPAPTMPAAFDGQATVEDAMGVIASATRPLVLAGRGARDANAHAAVLSLARRLGAPVATTLRGKDQFSAVPGNLGVFGTLSDEAALEIIGQADCVIAFGASLNQWTTAEGALLAGKSVVHVDKDVARINRYAPVTVGVHADAASAAAVFEQMLDEADIKATSFVDRAEAAVARRPGLPADLGTDTTVDIRTALRLVDEAMPTNKVVVTDNGRFIKYAFTALHVEHPSLYAHAVSFGSIGLGVATALGASYAAPDRPVLVACGDGGFAEGGLSELMNATMLHRNIIVLLLNDDAYGAEYVQLASRGMDAALTTFDWPDFGPIAAAMKADGATVRNTKELTDVLEHLRFDDGPVLLDVRIDHKRV
jgi:acetolactate synthase I/II/III large subunit